MARHLASYPAPCIFIFPAEVFCVFKYHKYQLVRILTPSQIKYWESTAGQMVMYMCSRCLFSIFTTPTNLRQTSKLLLSDNKNNFTIDTTSRDKILCLSCFFKTKSLCNKGFQFTFSNQSQSIFQTLSRQVR